MCSSTEPRATFTKEFNNRFEVQSFRGHLISYWTFFLLAYYACACVLIGYHAKGCCYHETYTFAFGFSFSICITVPFSKPQPPAKGPFPYTPGTQSTLSASSAWEARPPTSQHAMPPFVHISVSSPPGQGNGVRAAKPITCVLGCPWGRLAITAETVKIMCNHGERGAGVISDMQHKSCDCLPGE